MGIKCEWHVLLADEDWDKESAPESLLAQYCHEQSSEERRPLAPAWIATLVLAGIIVLGSGLTLWWQAQVGLSKIEGELSQAVAAEEALCELGSRAHLDNPATINCPNLIEPGQTLGAGPPPSVEITDFDLLSDMALVSLRTVSPSRPLPAREIRFYRQTGVGWQPTALDKRFWGSESSLESEFFVFNFRYRDRQTVLTAAPLLDQRYRQLHDLMGLTLPCGEQATVEHKILVSIVPVSMRQAMWRSEEHMALILPSPFLLPVPESITDADVLVEGAIYLLSDDVIRQVMHPRLGDDLYIPSYITRGVQLWLTWESGDSLTEYRGDLVNWLYSALPFGPKQLPERFDEICQVMAIWNQSGWGLGVYLPCDLAPPIVLSPMVPATHIMHLYTPVSVHWSGVSDPSVKGQSLAVATVLDYVADAFGPDAIPDLIRALGDGAKWQQVTVDQFGLDYTAFEAGWHAYLLAEYGVDLTTPAMATRPR